MAATMSLRRIIDGVSAWIDAVAEAIVASMGRLRSVRRVQLIEGEGEAFSIRIPGADAKSSSAAPSVRLGDGAPAALPAGLTLRGSQVELVLRSNQFLFRPLELPKRAAEFLDGIVRAQIDRLTPWSPADAVFGWTQPADASNERISLTVVATARARLTPYLRALAELGANSI